MSSLNIQTTAAQVGVGLGAVLLGSFLRTVGLLNKADAKAATILLKNVTFPALVLQSMLTYGLLGWAGPLTFFGSLIVNGVLAAVLWLRNSKRRQTEKALISGCGVTEIGSVAYSPIQAVFDTVGVHFAIIWDLGNLFSGVLLSRGLIANGSAKAPERYQHADGGMYRGVWRNGKKDGLGVYLYPNGARYEGRWSNNAKHGLGIYHYPKGGWFEGEWRDGERSGLGIRTLSSGRVKAGLWQGQSLLESRDPSECAFVAAQAREVAKASQRVPVGRHSIEYTLLELCQQPVIWVLLALTASYFSARPVPLLVDFASGHLASAHIPLALLTFGIGLDLQVPPSFQVKAVLEAVVARLLVPLVFAILAASFLSRQYTDLIAVAVICAMGPISEQVPYYTTLFNLNVGLGRHLVNASRIAALGAIAVFTAVVTFGNPGNSSVSRGLLLAALGVVAAITAVLGSTASWLLTSRPSVIAKKSLSAQPQQVSSANLRTQESMLAQGRGPTEVYREERPPMGSPLGAADGLSAAVSSPTEAAEAIPVGAAWEEIRREKEIAARETEPGADAFNLAESVEEGNLGSHAEASSDEQGINNSNSAESSSSASSEADGTSPLEGAGRDRRRRRNRSGGKGSGASSSGGGFQDVGLESNRLHEPCIDSMLGLQAGYRGSKPTWLSEEGDCQIPESPTYDHGHSNDIISKKRRHITEAVPCPSWHNQSHRLSVARPSNQAWHRAELSCCKLRTSKSRISWRRSISRDSQWLPLNQRRVAYWAV